MYSQSAVGTKQIHTEGVVIQCDDWSSAIRAKTQGSNPSEEEGKHVKEGSMIYIKSHNFSSLIDGFWSICREVVESEAGDLGQGFLMKDL